MKVCEVEYRQLIPPTSNKVRSYAFFLAMAAAAAFSGCAETQVRNQESLLSAAGFGALTSAKEGNQNFETLRNQMRSQLRFKL